MKTTGGAIRKQRFSCVLSIVVASSLIGQTISQAIASGVAPLEFLSFSSNNRTLANDDFDISSPEIFIPDGFPFGETVHFSAFIGDNGVISFGAPFLLYIPVQFPGTLTIDVVAPYWSDNDIILEGSVIYEVFQSESSPFENMTLAMVNDFIEDVLADGSSNFQGTYMILAEWRGVHPFPHSDSSRLTTNQREFTDLTNTYQAIVITDLEQSYAIFTYKCGELQWTGLDDNPTIGFFSVANGMFENHPLSRQSTANQIACGPNLEYNNVLYPIGRVDRRLVQSCLRWYRSDLNIYGRSFIAGFDQILPSCPCSFSQVLTDFRLFFTFVASKTSVCFRQRFPPFGFPFGSPIRECCYSLPFGALLTGTQNGGSLLVSYIPDESLQQNNRVPQQECCAPGVGLCDLYYERRPSDDCTFYIPPWWTWFWGDPHFTTLDGFTYTFNGIGEYVLVRSMEDDIEFQARTELVENSGATAFSAFAIRNNNTIVQVSGELTILVNSTNRSSDLMTVGSEIQTPIYSLERLATNSLRLSFSSGVTLTTNVTNGIFNFVLNLPPTLIGRTEGLLGAFNGNQSDDLIFRNGTLLPITSRDADIHVFGQSWQINETESIFEYMPGESVSTFSDPDHVPPFLDEISQNLGANETLTNVCGNNMECLFDFAQTGNEGVGMATMAFMETVVEDVVMSETFPPNISAPIVFVATIGTNSTYTFTITGSVVDVNVIINGQNFVINEENVVINSQNSPNLPPNTNLNRNGDIFTLTWSPTDISEKINVSIIANGERNTTSSFNPRVQLCGCANGGNCTEAGILDLEVSFVLLNCDCPEAYDGRFCQDDANGCDAISCLPGQSCEDNRAPASGAICACPMGYLVINSKCVDIDECNSSTHDCNELQVCTNTRGSFTCSCRRGYTASMESPLLCEDVNECDEGRDGCHQICTNTNGSFECSCLPQFELNTDQRTCNVSADAECLSNNTCEQVCYTDNVTMTEICTCNPGFELDANNINCSDINECLTNNGGCSQSCTNTVGGFSCSCNSSFDLDEDGRTCNDINECQTAMALCPMTFVCNNLIGGFECVCPLGTTRSSDELCVIDPPSTTTSTTTTSTTTTSSTIPTVTPNITPVTSADSQSDGLSGGEIAAIVIGSVFGAALLLAIIVITALWINYKRKSKSVDFITGQRGSTGSLRRRPVSTVIAANDE